MARTRGKPSPKGDKTAAVIIFADIRGFSQWSEQIDADENTVELVTRFQEIVMESFKGCHTKQLGDGTMIVQEADLILGAAINSAIKATIARISRVERRFKTIVTAISLKAGAKADLRLGWGIARGNVIRLPGKPLDYIGHQVNKAARLCDLARPFGVVIDRDDFGTAPTNYRTDFFKQQFRLSKPAKDVEVWSSLEIFEEFRARETLRETPEVHVAGVCIRENGDGIEVLIARRRGDRDLFPGKWEGCGGQLRNSESFADGVTRHYTTEMKIDVVVDKNVYPELYQIESPNKPLIPGLRFLCRYQSGEPQSRNHTEFKWVRPGELERMKEADFPPGFQRQALVLIGRAQSLSPPPLGPVRSRAPHADQA